MRSNLPPDVCFQCDPCSLPPSTSNRKLQPFLKVTNKTKKREPHIMGVWDAGRGRRGELAKHQRWEKRRGSGESRTTPLGSNKQETFH